MSTITPSAHRLTEAIRHAAGADLPPVDNALFPEPHRLAHSLEITLAGTISRVRVAGTLDRRLVFIERA